ncbi:hypothetical protein [uncultured Dokdonia sp.]|uniref:hypothetical protein n=1 Tax=uncultured Dokdonia sp. TaxID=575653 RepID=UPI00260F8C85|nr:hypothetical protein [uncultured Dokdonia sp.]
MSITNKRKHQLGFCAVCLHKQSGSDFVVKCKLTQEVASFETECPSFLLDVPTIIKRRITQEKKVLDRFHPTLHPVEKFLNNTTTQLTNKEAFNSPIHKATKKNSFQRI